MNITVVFFLGMFVALIGVIPPGLLNMTAAKISLKDGPGRGIIFSIGVCIVVFIQAFIAAQFARYLSHRQDIIDILQRVAFVIFVLITIYFLVLASKEKEAKLVETNIKSKKSRLFYGMLLSALNIFPLPYQAYMTITLASFGLMDFEHITITSYVTGAAMGTFVMLYIYIFFIDKIRSKAITTQRNMNYMIGSITGVIALVTLINIIREI